MNKQLLTNAISTSLQFVLVGLSVFFLYRFLLIEIGPERFGLWSLAVSLTTTSSAVGFGISAALVKYVAKYLVYNDQYKVALLIETALLTLIVVIGVVLFPLYYLFEFLFSRIVEGELFFEGIRMLPFVLVAFWVSNIGQVYWSAVDGYQRIDIRNLALTLINGILFVILAFWFTPQLGLMGLAYAYLIRAVVWLIYGAVIIKKLSPKVKVLGFRWRYSLLKEMLSYGLSFQVISISQIVIDPIMKYLVARFGSLGMVGYFELAFQMVKQLKGVLSSANGVIVPAVAELYENAKERLEAVYESTFQLVFYINSPFYAVLITLIPFISKIWIGYVESNFVFFSTVLSVAFFINSLVGPAFFINMGTGKLKHNVYSHLIITVSSVVLGFFMGKAFGGKGVGGSLGVSIIIGSVYLMYMYSKEAKLTYSILFSVENLRLMFSIGLFIFGVKIFNGVLNLKELDMSIQLLILLSLFVVVNFYPIWNHSKRRELQKWVLNYF